MERDGTWVPGLKDAAILWPWPDKSEGQWEEEAETGQSEHLRPEAGGLWIKMWGWGGRIVPPQVWGLMGACVRLALRRLMRGPRGPARQEL